MFRSFLAAISVACFAFAAAAAPEAGKPAPDFTATDIHGKTVSVSALKGKTVILEWNNPDCPFVVKHYGSGNMQKLQAYAQEQKAVWLTVNSSATGKQGNLTTEQAKNYIAKQNAAPDHYLLDPEGKIGKLYDAKTTPHMFVIDKDGNIAYMGAIDDKASTDARDVATAKNYVTATLDSLAGGNPVSVTSTQAYGCNVKY
jgi:peroxiredoxin